MVAKKVFDGAVVECVKETPPSRGVISLSTRLAEPLAEIKKSPGEWFRVMTYPTASLSAARAAPGVLRKQVPGYEFRQGNGSVYARYVGEENV